jgi:F420-non-reducing hydrogenase small subunit
LPPKGSVLAPDIALCDECPRKASKPTDLSFTEFKRPHQKLLDAEKCLLAQGIVCLGPATRGGCEALCPGGNMPCSGCFGPTSRVRDQGAKMLSSLCANVAAKTEAEIDKALAGVPDPVGTFYRYGLAHSLLRRKR